MKLYNFVAIAVFTMLVSTVWAYEPAPDAQEAPPPHVAAVTAPAVPTSARPQLREGDYTDDGRRVGTPVPQRRSTTEAHNEEWINGQINVAPSGTITLVPRNPKPTTRVVVNHWRTKWRTRTRTVHVGLTAEEVKGLIETDGTRVIKAVNKHTNTVVADLIERIRSDHQKIYDAVVGINDQLAGLSLGQWIIGLMVAAILVIVILILRRLGKNAQTPILAAPAAPAQTLATSTVSAVDQVTGDEATKAADATAEAMKVAKAAGNAAITANEKAGVACRGVSYILPEIFAEEDEEGAEILAELARLELS